jgi:two-component system, LytTR family, response regulator
LVLFQLRQAKAWRYKPTDCVSPEGKENPRETRINPELAGASPSPVPLLVLMRALVIDDEAPARAVLQHLLGAHCPDVTVVAATADPIEGLALIRQHEPDVLFLDVEMPHLSGFEVLRALGPAADRLRVIFVTAYDQYAIRAIRFAAVDYLLKPVDPDELIAAVARVRSGHARPPAPRDAAPAPAAEPVAEVPISDRYGLLTAPPDPAVAVPTRLTLPTADGLLVVRVEDIQCCEASGAYTLVHLRDRAQPVVVSRSLKEYDDLLTGAGHPFFRVHHSWLINLAEVRRYIRGDGGLVELAGGRQIDVAKRRKDDFLAALGRL